MNFLKQLFSLISFLFSYEVLRTKKTLESKPYTWSRRGSRILLHNEYNKLILWIECPEEIQENPFHLVEDSPHEVVIQRSILEYELSKSEEMSKLEDLLKLVLAKLSDLTPDNKKLAIITKTDVEITTDTIICIIHITEDKLS